MAKPLPIARPRAGAEHRGGANPGEGAEPPPVACSLTAAELPARQADMRAIGRRWLVSAGERELRFRPEARAALERIVAAEADCCGFMTLGLSEENGALSLRVSGPPEADPIVAELMAAFAND